MRSKQKLLAMFLPQKSVETWHGFWYQKICQSYFNFLRWALFTVAETVPTSFFYLKNFFFYFK